MIEQLAFVSDAELLAELVELEAELARVQISAQGRCTRSEARKRAHAVERFGGRRALTGEALEPVYPAAAEALAAGQVGVEHAAAICGHRGGDPGAVRAEHASTVESTLLLHAPDGRSAHGAVCWVSGSWPTWPRMARARTSNACSRRTGRSI